MVESLQHFLHQWPQLNGANHHLTSEATDAYNCAAYAAYDEKNLWWPTKGYYWPFPKDDIPEVENFLRYFQSIKYKVCVSELWEPEFEKVAIYTNKIGKVRHLARQDLQCRKHGWWQSKMGNLEDIMHEHLAVLEGDFYGRVKYILRRPAL